MSSSSRLKFARWPQLKKHWRLYPAQFNSSLQPVATHWVSAQWILAECTTENENFEKLNWKRTTEESEECAGEAVVYKNAPGLKAGHIVYREWGKCFPPSGRSASLVRFREFVQWSGVGAVYEAIQSYRVNFWRATTTTVSFNSQGMQTYRPL